MTKKNNDVDNPQLFGEDEEWIDWYAIRDWLLDFVKQVASRAKLFFAIWFGLVALVVIFLLVVPERFTANSKLMPEVSGGGAGSSLGILSSIPAASMLLRGNSSMDTYPVVARSRRVFDEIKDMPYGDETIIQVLSGSDEITPKKVEQAYRTFAKDLKSSTDNESGVVTFSYEHRDPRFAAVLVNAVLDKMDLYFRQNLKTETGEQLAAIKMRIHQVSDSLRLAEENLEEFRSSNRSFAGSPTLQLAEGRLRRQVEVFNAVYIELTKQHELLKIESIEDITLLNVLDRASAPQIRSYPGSRAITTITAAFFSFFLAAFWVRYQQTIFEVVGTVTNAIRKGSKKTEDKED